MFPLESVLLPGVRMPLHVFEERYRVMTRQCLDSDRTFGVVLIERGREVGGGDVRAGYGTTAVIEADSSLPDGHFALVCRGEHRLQVGEWLLDDPYPQAMVEIFDEPEADPDAGDLALAESAVRRAWGLLSELGASSPQALSTGTLVGSSWLWSSLAPLSPIDQLALLKAATATKRLRLVAQLSDAVAEDARRLLAEHPR
ncbi:MAG: LON peptidase substrate-binding domain-containing protein [Acidimicrobiales bacterium]